MKSRCLFLKAELTIILPKICRIQSVEILLVQRIFVVTYSPQNLNFGSLKNMIDNWNTINSLEYRLHCHLRNAQGAKSDTLTQDRPCPLSAKRYPSKVSKYCQTTILRHLWTSCCTDTSIRTTIEIQIFCNFLQKLKRIRFQAKKIKKSPLENTLF